MNTTNQEVARELAPERLYVVAGEWGVTAFVDKDVATGYPGPRMFECSPRTVIEYIRADRADDTDPPKEYREGYMAAFAEVSSEFKDLIAERDALKAENERLKGRVKALGRPRHKW